MAWKPRRLWVTMTAAPVAVLALAAFACGDAEPPPAPSPTPAPVISAPRTPPPTATPAPTPEPLIDRSQASHVQIGEPVIGEVEAHGDFDLFRFRADAGQWYQIDAARRSLGDSELELYDPDGQPLAYSDNYPGQDWAARIVWRAPTAGDYYAKVSSPYKVDTGTYEFSAAAVDIQDEHGDSAGDATDIAVGEVVESSLEHPADSDWFRFQAAEGAIYEISAPETMKDDYNRVETWLYDFHGETLNSSFWSVTLGEDGKIFWKATKSGDHYVKVVSDFFARETSYSLTVSISDIADDHHDNSMAATPISVGASVGGSIDYEGDSDCFRFRAEGGRTYGIDVASETLWATQIILYGADGAPLTSERSPYSRDAPAIVWNAPKSGDYYIRVGSVNVGSTGHPYPTPPAPPCEAGYILPDGPPGTYTLALAEFSVPDDPPALIALGRAIINRALDHPNDVDNFSSEDIPDDHANDKENATRVALSETARGAIDYTGDSDYFVFLAEAGNFYSVIQKTDLPKTVIVSIREPSGYVLEWRVYNPGDHPALWFVWQAPESGDYRMEVRPRRSQPELGDYSFAVELADFADDHANEKENATRIAPGETIEGSVDYAGDQDFFVFRAEAGREYTARAEPSGMGNIWMQIHDFRQAIAYARDESGEAATLRWTAPDSRDYYIDATAHEKEIGSYRLTLE